MLRLQKTRIGANTFHMDVAPGYEITQEGVVLVAHFQNGKTYVKPSEGRAGERFIGFSLTRSAALDRATVVNEYQVPAVGPYEVETGLSFIGNQFAARVGNSSLGNVDADPAAGEVRVQGTRLVFNAAQAGQTVEVHGAYLPTYEQSITVQGANPAGGLGTVAAGVVGVIRSGNVYTDRYMVDADFTPSEGTDPVKLRTAPNGFLTAGGNGADLSDHLELLEVPSLGNGFLGVRCLG